MASEIFEVKVIRAKKLNVEAYADEIRKALQAEGRDVIAEYEKTTATWRKKPKFEAIVDTSGSDAAVLVGTDNEVYGYVDKGTRPHIIRPVRAKRLRFLAGFTPKTKPRVIGSTRGGSSPPVVYAQMVRHPGSKAREFSDTIAKRRKSKFTRRMVKAMQTASGKAF